MIELFGLFGLVAVGVFLVGAVAVAFVMLRLVDWLLFLPLLLLKGLFGVAGRSGASPGCGHRWYDRRSRHYHPDPTVPADLGLLVWAVVALVARPAAA